MAEVVTQVQVLLSMFFLKSTAWAAGYSLNEPTPNTFAMNH